MNYTTLNCEYNRATKITKIIIEQNYFQYENKIYYDPKGLPTGGPLSATLAELYMDNYKNAYSFRNPHANKIKMYSRYVDDSFMILRASKRQATILLNFLNQINPSIQYNIEMEDNNKINFLDITIYKQETGNFSIDIYRKPTQTDLVLPAKSNHPYSQKAAAFCSLVYRLENYCLSKPEYDKEKSIIEQIALNNGYKPDYVNRIIEQTKKNKNEMNNSPDKEKQKYIPIPYIDNISEKIGHVFHKSGFIPAYKAKTNLIQALKPRETPQPLDDK